MVVTIGDSVIKMSKWQQLGARTCCWNAEMLKCNPWDMPSNFTVYDCLSCCQVMMPYIKCLCWSLGHAEQLLFSCLCSKVTVYDCLSCCYDVIWNMSFYLGGSTDVFCNSSANLFFQGAYCHKAKVPRSSYDAKDDKKRSQSATDPERHDRTPVKNWWDEKKSSIQKVPRRGLKRWKIKKIRALLL